MTPNRLDDPTGEGAIGSAVGWLQGAVTGSLATAIAIIAVASVGFLMLNGRIELRRAMQAIVGCFIVLGASSIVSGIRNAGGGAGGAPVTAHIDPPPLVSPVYPEANAQPYDPYAGAALTTR